MKRSAYLFLFLLLSFTGYCCQVGRFYTALQQYSASHTYNKSLTKKVLARTINSFNEERKVHVSKERCRTVVGFGFVISQEILSLSATEINYSFILNSNYFSDPFSDGEREPPIRLIVS